MHCHLLVYGIDHSYNPWVSHGESVHQIDNNEEGYIGEDSDNESDEISYDDMGPFVYDATNAWKSMNTTLDENERKEGTPNLEEVVAANDDEVRLVRDDTEPELVDVDVVLEAAKNVDMDNESEEEEENEEDDDD
ncbi:Replicase polyprotein 1a [Bienertia sinuspersici]